MNTATDNLEESLEADRANLRETLSAIEEKMSPGRMIDEAMAYFQTGPREFASLLADQVKSNPLPVVLTGVGLAWLVANGSAARGDSATPPTTSAPMDEDHEAWETYDRITQFELDCSRLGDEPHDDWQTRLHASRASALGLQRSHDEDEPGFMARVADATEAARSKGAAARDRVRDSLKNARKTGGHILDVGQAAVGDLGEKTKAQTQAAVVAASRMHDANPMVTGALAVAVGAMLGALIPQGKREDAALGQLADQGLDHMASAARSAADALTSRMAPESEPGLQT